MMMIAECFVRISATAPDGTVHSMELPLSDGMMYSEVVRYAHATLDSPVYDKDRLPLYAAALRLRLLEDKLHLACAADDPAQER